MNDEDLEEDLINHFISHIKTLISCVENCDIETMSDCDKWHVFSSAISAMKYIANKYEINY